MARQVLADTDVLIDYQAAEGAALLVRRLVTEGRLAVPTIACYELVRGASDAASRETVRRLLGGVTVLDFRRQDAGAAAEVWRSLSAHQRNAIGDRDILIAGVAISRGLPVLTRNRGHFRTLGVRLYEG
jgi:tRNA(fMet)-specific endonuclease VapC